ncbi:MAG: ComEA family DNA-binding protein [Chloroflexota bacterium]
MNVSWDRIAGWVTLLALGFALGVGFLSLRQSTQPEPIEIIPPEPTATAQPLPTESLIRVYVTGAVQQAAVYELAPDSIVDDAVKAAGGFSADANPVAINLAQPLSDGMQVYVPSLVEEATQPPVITGGGNDATNNSRFGADLFAGLVNINQASAAELESLPGIGPSTAAKIIAYREANGPFASVEALLEVSGIGDAKLDAIRELISVNP